MTSGVAKWLTSKKVVRYVIIIILIVVVVLVIMRIIGPVFGEYIEFPKKGEKARFMRYMGCAMAMCAAPGDQADGCYSDKVMELKVEYDEAGENPVKGCQQVCIEVRDLVGGPQKHYCGEDYAINFTFQNNVKYIGNYSISGNLWERDVSCGIGKTGFQTDASCTGGWEAKGILDCACFSCVALGGGPDGRLAMKSGDCGREEGTTWNSYKYSRLGGTIWIPESLVGNDEPGKCIKGNIPDLDDLGLAWCRFQKDQEIYIWAERGIPARQDCWWLICSLIPSYHDCPQVIICDSEP